MATLEELCELGVLDRIDPLEPGELTWRTLYGTMDFLAWLEDVLPTLNHNDLYSDLTPQEQVYAVFFEYVSGVHLSTDRRFKKLSYNPDLSVWEFKTEEVRIFGWVPRKDAFICCFGDSKDNTAIQNSVGRYIAQTSYFRNCQPLDEPKCLTSGSYEDVISTKA